MNLLLNLTPYALSGATLILAFFSMGKDWRDYRNSKIRITVLLVLCVVTVLTFVNQHRENTEKARQQGRVDAASKSQSDNTNRFMQSLDNLNSQIAELKTQAKTDALQKKLTSVQADLEATRKALAPGPKAVLSFSFWPFYNPAPPLVPILAKQARVPVNEDGSYHVEFTVVNATDVDALDGDITLKICDACKFSKEPEGFAKIEGQPDSERNKGFQRILAKTELGLLSADIIAPRNNSFVVGMTYRCHTCVLSLETDFGRVLVPAPAPATIRKQPPNAVLPRR